MLKIGYGVYKKGKANASRHEALAMSLLTSKRR